MKIYKRKPERPVIAVQLNLETNGFSYTKWGGVQNCKQGDWLVFNQPDSDGYAMSDTKFQSLYELASEN